MSSDAWNRLDRLVQVSYSATDVCLIYSEFKASCWHLRVLNQQAMYHLKLNNENALENVMQQRQPIAASPDQFVEWFSSSMIHGQMAMVTADRLRVGDTKCWLDLRLEPVDDTRLRHEFSWQLLIKLALHVQKQGCVIDISHHRSSETRMNELQQENESLRAELKAALSVQTSADEGATFHRPQQRPRVMSQPRTGGMSIVNPGVKRRKRTHAEFKEPPPLSDEDSS